MFNQCPGVANLKTPTLSIKTCPQCGEEVEVFSTDLKVTCPSCGFVIFNDTLSCINWCKYARECVGDEIYNRLVKKKEK